MRFLSIIILSLCFFLSPYVLYAQQATYVFVHGAWGGAWQFKKTGNALVAAGDVVYRPTLTGLGERVHLADTTINLETHINDVVNTILFEDLQDIILVGHSYGGMVITGVADRLPLRIKRLVYLDAILPEHGESVGYLMQKSSYAKAISKPLDFITPVWVRDTTKTPRDVPHPVRSLTQAISLTDSLRTTIPATYILTVDAGKNKEQDDFYPFYLRALNKKFKVQIMEADHNPQIKHLAALVNLLQEEK